MESAQGRVYYLDKANEMTCVDMTKKKIEISTLMHKKCIAKERHSPFTTKEYLFAPSL